MFVSSFNTYVTNDFSQKVAKSRNSEQKRESASFQFKMLNNPLKLSNTSAKPINYISNSHTKYTKQMLDVAQKEIQSLEKKNFKKAQESTKNFKTSTLLKSASTAYATTFTSFHSLRKPHTPVSNQTPQVDKNLPKEAQEAQESAIRHTMVNTYLENDKYYKITA